MAIVRDLSIFNGKTQQIIKQNLMLGEQVVFCVEGIRGRHLVVTNTRLLYVLVYFGGDTGVSGLDPRDIASIDVAQGWESGVLGQVFRITVNSIGQPPAWVVLLRKAGFEEFKPHLDQLRTMIQQAKSGQGVTNNAITPRAGISELERLVALHKEGHLTDEEFRAAKAKLLGL